MSCSKAIVTGGGSSGRIGICSKRHSPVSVTLCTSSDAAAAAWTDVWIAVTGTHSELPEANRFPDSGRLLEQAFDACRDTWWELSAELSAGTGGHLSHAATCAPYVSDFGLMLAWRRIVADVASSPETVLVLCDDPWVFRALSGLPNVSARAAPRLWGRALSTWLRGWTAGLLVALRVAVASLKYRSIRKNGSGGVSLIVYGHPDSTSERDAYFGTLLAQIPELGRTVHTDDFRAVWRLSEDGRTESFHAYGSLIYALFVLPFVKWRSHRVHRDRSIDWLIFRARSLESGGGAAAMSAWQIHCQARWLAERRPRRIAWPWENHPWERALVRTARRLGIVTVGYQHTDAGPHQFNMSPHATPGAMDDLPDYLMLNGPAYRNQFIAWGIPAERLVVAGAFRLPAAPISRYSAGGPVFVALSSNPEVSREMMAAVYDAQGLGRKFLVKSHPMYPFQITESSSVEMTRTRFSEMTGVSALFYGTGTSGIEGMLAGVPTYRLLPSDRVGIETMPDGLRAHTVTRHGLRAALDDPAEPPEVDVSKFFTPVDLELWRRHLSAS